MSGTGLEPAYLKDYSHHVTIYVNPLVLLDFTRHYSMHCNFLLHKALIGRLKLAFCPWILDFNPTDFPLLVSNSREKVSTQWESNPYSLLGRQICSRYNMDASDGNC